MPSRRWRSATARSGSCTPMPRTAAGRWTASTARWWLATPRSSRACSSGPCCATPSNCIPRGSARHWRSARVGRLEDAAGLVSPRATGGDARLIESLTARELDVLRLLARGNTNLAIATALVVREGTVKYHVKNILRKLGATSRADAVAKYVRAGDRAG